MAIWRTRIACWITKAINTHTHTHTQYVMLTAFLLQQLLQEGAPMLRLRKLLVLGISSISVHQTGLTTGNEGL